MYEATSEAKEFIAADRAEAVANACGYFGVEEEALAVSEPAEGEIYGLGGRMVIVAGPKGASRARSDERSEERRPRRGDSERRERSGREERPRRGDRSRRDGGRGEQRSRRPESEDRDHARETLPSESREPVEDSVGSVVGELDDIGEFVQGTVERMGLGPFEISKESEGDYLVYQLRGAAAAELGSGDGRGVDALQLLANQFAMKTHENAPRVVVDAEGDPERREAFLARLADRAARRARDTRRAVALDAMNSRDRRLLHVALRDEDDVATMSIGSGRYRQVVVVPEGSPEYEDACRYAEESESRKRDA